MLRHRLFLAVLALSLQAYPQNDGCLSRSVVMTVRALPRQHVDGPIMLKPTDLNARLAEKDVSVESVLRSPNPFRVVVVLDAGAAQTKVTWDASLAIAHDLPSAVPDNTEFSLLTFDSNVQTPTSFKPGPHALDDALAGLSPTKNRESRDALYDALSHAIDGFGGARAGNSIFLITAWEGPAQSVDLRRPPDARRDDDKVKPLLRMLSENDTRLFGVSFDQSVVHLLGDGYAMAVSSGLTPLEGAARTSGGLWLRGTGRAPAAYAVKATGTAMEGFYTVALRLAQPITEPGTLRVDLSASGKSRLKGEGDPDIKLFYPPTLGACR
jgi:hypothetical protein